MQVGHGGVNNDFLVATWSHVALVHNDTSPLENMHSYLLFATARRAGCDVLAGLEPSQRRTARELIIRAILATDLKTHAEKTNKLQTLAAAVKMAAVELERAQAELVALRNHAAEIAAAAALAVGEGDRHASTDYEVTSHGGDGEAENDSASEQHDTPAGNKPYSVDGKRVSRASNRTTAGLAAGQPGGTGSVISGGVSSSHSLPAAALEAAVTEVRIRGDELLTKRKELGEAMLIGAMKMGDIAHPLRAWTCHAEWTRRITREFFTQVISIRYLVTSSTN